MDFGNPFPYISYSRGKEFYRSLLYLKSLDENLPSNQSILNRAGFSLNLRRYSYRTKERERIEKYIDNLEGEIAPSELLDLLIKKMDPDRIVKDRLYSVPDLTRFIKNKFNPALLLKLVKGDDSIKKYRVGNTVCVMGKDVPRMKRIMRECKRIDRRFKNRYPVVEEDFVYVSVTDIAEMSDMNLSLVNTRLKERPEARSMIYRTLNTGKRMVREEDVGEFIRIIKKKKNE